MRYFRRHHLRARLSILVVVALLWSQFALTAHSGCVTAEKGHPHGVASQAMPDCAHEAPQPEEPVCKSHCSQGGLSNDVARVPPLPPLPAMLGPPWVTVVAPPRAAVHLLVVVDGPPPVSWHRPTAHPAALLLL